ncbi:MAG: glycosyltransferase family 2 protein [Thermoleophilia bacterium]|nr:glycosyltransferase family 2 protein [Thermoleophilia bacterium]
MTETRERAPSETISACIVCRNEGDRLEECLASAAWADEILVLDLESDDGSADVARRQGARVIPHPVVPIVERVRNEIAAHARGDWILVLDPDERVSPGLARALDAVRGREDLAAVDIPFMHFDFGHAPTNPVHRYDHKVRMYRRSRVAWPTIPNELPRVPRDAVHRLPSRDDVVMLHYRNRTIPEALERVLRYAPAEAEAMIAAGETFTAREMVRTLWRKVNRHFVRANALGDGVPGFMRASVLVAFDLYVWAAFWQMSGARKTPEDDVYMRRLGRGLKLVAGVARLAESPRRVRAKARRWRS